MRILSTLGKFTFLLLVLPFGHSIYAQDTWDLRKCIDYAQENSLTLKQAKYSAQMAGLTDKQNRMNRLPSVNGVTTGGFQFGRTIDPTTNSFNNERITFQSYGVNANMAIYNGGSINKSIEQSGYDLKAAQADANVAFNNTALNIANAYLQILMAEEQLENAQKRKVLSEEQLTQTDKLIQAGTLPENDRLEILAQIARDEQTIIQAQNLIDLNYLNLKEFMQLDPSTDITIERPEVVIPNNADPIVTTFTEVYRTAVSTQPQIIRDEMSLKSAELDVDLAQAAMLPQLALFAGIDTRWSSAARQYLGEIPNGNVNEQVVLINNNEVTVGFPGSESQFEDISYIDQLDQNFGQNLGLQLSVPLYNNHRNAINVERAKIGILNSKLQSDLTKQQLKVDVQNAIASARAGQRSMQAAEKTLDAARAAYENAQRQYELGVINTFQFTTARNSMDMAEIDLTVAKYDYLFRLKIIDFYLGKKLELN